LFAPKKKAVAAKKAPAAKKWLRLLKKTDSA
jgi:hypothetical protein